MGGQKTCMELLAHIIYILKTVLRLQCMGHAIKDLVLPIHL